MGQAVLEERTQPALHALVDRLPPAGRYCPDGFTNDQALVWPLDSQHSIAEAKEETDTIEGMNADRRTYRTRVARTRRWFSRCIHALRRALRLFVWYYNRRQRMINTHIIYTGKLCLVF